MSDDFSEMLNANLDGWNAAMGVRFVKATLDEVVAEWTVGKQHLQAYGIVHGGTHCGVIETVASVGAALNAMSRGQSVVGLENHTSFINATRAGVLRCTGKPITCGRRSQVWEGTVTSEDGKIVATGRVRILCLDGDANLAGKKVELEP
ncbi:MAG: PaaI family thioesterase [Polyangiales bacterium]